MDSQRLQLLLKEIQTNIDDFRKGLAESENQYRGSIKLTINPGLSSLLMEQYVVHIEQQRASLSKMEILFDQVRDQLTRLDESN